MVGRFLLHVCTYASLAVALTACDPCDNRILQELPDPTGTTKAVIFQRSCGPFGGTSTQISVLPMSTQRLIAGGNTFSADTADGSAPALPSGGPPVVVTWGKSSGILRHLRFSRPRVPSRKTNQQYLYFLRRTISRREDASKHTPGSPQTAENR